MRAIAYNIIAKTQLRKQEVIGMRNLIAEMARSGVRTNDIQSVLNVSERTAQYKVSGKSQFTVDEAFKVRDTFFPGLRLEYLFCSDENNTTQQAPGQ